MSRSGRRQRRLEPGELGLRQRLWRVSAAIGEIGDLLGRHLPLADERSEHERTRTPLAHGKSGGSTIAQAIEHEIADRRPVARPGKAVRRPPILQGFRRGPLARLHVGENFDRRARPRRRRHQAA